MFRLLFFVSSNSLVSRMNDFLFMSKKIVVRYSHWNSLWIVYKKITKSLWIIKKTCPQFSYLKNTIIFYILKIMILKEFLHLNQYCLSVLFFIYKPKIAIENQKLMMIKSSIHFAKPIDRIWSPIDKIKFYTKNSSPGFHFFLF